MINTAISSWIKRRPKSFREMERINALTRSEVKAELRGLGLKPTESLPEALRDLLTAPLRPTSSICRRGIFGSAKEYLVSFRPANSAMLFNRCGMAAIFLCLVTALFVCRPDRRETDSIGPIPVEELIAKEAFANFTLTGSVMIRIPTRTSRGTIRHTTNGSDPTSRSYIHKRLVPFNLKATAFQRRMTDIQSLSGHRPQTQSNDRVAAINTSVLTGVVIEATDPAAGELTGHRDSRSKRLTASAHYVATASVHYVATAYRLDGQTASGQRISKGLIAADPSVLPLGTRVRLDAGSYSGEYLVADTGGAVRGKRIDIWTPSSHEAMRFGRRMVKLTVLSYGPKRNAVHRQRSR